MNILKYWINSVMMYTGFDLKLLEISDLISMKDFLTICKNDSEFRTLMIPHLDENFIEKRLKQIERELKKRGKQ